MLVKLKNVFATQSNMKNEKKKKKWKIRATRLKMLKDSK